MRKLNPKTFKSQCKLLLKAVSSNCRSNSQVIGDDIGALEIIEFEAENKTDNYHVTPGKRVRDLLDGLSLLFNSTVKGVKGCLHSKGGNKLSVVFDLLIALNVSVLDNILKIVRSTKDKKSKKNDKNDKNDKKKIGAVEKNKNPKQLSSNTYSDIEDHNENNGKNDGIEKTVRISDLSEEDQKAVRTFSYEDAWMTYTVTQVLTSSLIRLFRYLHPSNLAELWLRLLSVSQEVVKAGKVLNILLLEEHSLEGSDESKEGTKGTTGECSAECTLSLSASVECSSVFIVEALLFALCHSKGRGLSDSDVKKSVEDQLINVCMDLCETALAHRISNSQAGGTKGKKEKGENLARREGRVTDRDTDNGHHWQSPRLIERTRLLFCRLWLAFPRNLTLLARVDRFLAASVPSVWPCPAAPLFASELFPSLPVDISRK